MNGKKFELVQSDTITLGDGTKLYRIRALRDVGRAGLRPVAKAGRLGGYVENEANLSQEGAAWVADDAKVYGKARVSDDALVSGMAEVSGSAQVRDTACVMGFAQVGDSAVVCDDALVHRQARVHGGAVVCGKACVDGGNIYGDAVVRGPLDIGSAANISKPEDILSFEGLLASDKQLAAYRTIGGSVEVRFGSFRGPLSQFRARAETPLRYEAKTAWQLLGLANLIEHHFAA